MKIYDTLLLLDKKRYPSLDKKIKILSQYRQVYPEPFSLIDNKFLKLIHDCELLITGWGASHLEPKLIKNAKKLKLIFHTAGSIKGFIDKSIFELGIRVSHSAKINAYPTAQFAFAMIILAGKKTFKISRYFYSTKALRSKDIKNIGNYKKTVGIISASKVGILVLEMLKLSDFEILVYDPYANKNIEDKFNCKLVDLHKLLINSSIISIHAPNLESTKNMIGKNELKAMKDDTTIINTSRGGIIDQKALTEELIKGRLNAILDVTTPEPLEYNSILWDLENVFLTPHIAGSMGNEVNKMSEFMIEEVNRFNNKQVLEGEIFIDDYDLLA